MTRRARAKRQDAALCANERKSRPVSRVLSRAIIPLGSTSPWTSSGLPGSARGSALRALLPEPAASLFGLAPGGVCHASPCYQGRGALLPHRFTLAGPRGFRRESLGGLLSVALSVGSRPPGVTWHLIRRSPDFPPPDRCRGSDCPAGSHGYLNIGAKSAAPLLDLVPAPSAGGLRPSKIAPGICA